MYMVIQYIYVYGKLSQAFRLKVSCSEHGSRSQVQFPCGAELGGDLVCSFTGGLFSTPL